MTDKLDIKFGPYDITPSSIFFESKFCYGLVNLKPIVPGHVLIIPKNVVKRCGDLSLEEATDLLQNTNSATVSKHYRHKGAEHYTKLSVVRENLHKKILND